jgi:hypothetical protein
MPGLTGDEALRKRLHAIADTHELLAQVALLGVAEAKKLVPHVTRNLSRTIRVGQVTAKSARVLAGGTSRVGYARYVEEGTGIHGPRGRRITPRKARVLSWKTKGKRFFAASVAGRKATPYLVPGVEKAAKRAGVDVIVKAWNEAA